MPEVKATININEKVSNSVLVTDYLKIFTKVPSYVKYLKYKHIKLNNIMCQAVIILPGIVNNLFYALLM